MVSDTTILRKIEQQPKQSAGLKQLVRELGVRGEDRRAFVDRLHQLVHRGELVAQDGDRFAIPKQPSDKNLVAGRLTMHRDGYGFVIPDSPELRQRLDGDIYVGPQNTDNAMHGDRVLVELRREGRDGRAEGQIVRVIGRAHATVVGTFHYGQRYNYVTPIDEKIRQVPTSQHVVDYAVDLVRATRPREAPSPDFVKNWLAWGAGPRAAQNIILGAKARAILHGRYTVSADDIRTLAYPVLRHRIFTNFNADAEGIDVNQVIEKILTHLGM